MSLNCHLLWYFIILVSSIQPKIGCKRKSSNKLLLLWQDYILGYKVTSSRSGGLYGMLYPIKTPYLRSSCPKIMEKIRHYHNPREVICCWIYTNRCYKNDRRVANATLNLTNLKIETHTIWITSLSLDIGINKNHHIELHLQHTAVSRSHYIAKHGGNAKYSFLHYSIFFDMCKWFWWTFFWYHIIIFDPCNSLASKTLKICSLGVNPLHICWEMLHMIAWIFMFPP